MFYRRQGFGFQILDKGKGLGPAKFRIIPAKKKSASKA
jgi:hypothetical protein